MRTTIEPNKRQHQNPAQKEKKIDLTMVGR